MKLTRLFLKAKHWQLFLLIFGIPFVFQIILMLSTIFQLFTSINPDPTVMFKFMNFIPFIILIPTLTLFGWLWSIGMGFQNKIPVNVKLKVKRFKLFFFIPFIYILIFILIFSFILLNVISMNPNPNLGLIALLFAIIFPLHLFSIFCIFYTFYFIAKTIKTVELQRDVVFADFIGEFFMLWFYPVGIWILQPKINKLTTP